MNIKFLKEFSNILWTVPIPILMTGLGLYLSIKTRCFHIRYLKKSICGAFDTKTTENNAVSPFASVCTALSATVGTGNIAGVAGAIALGGAGAVFWMWITAFLGMIIKLCECVLAIKYREKKDGDFVGGPMYYIKNALHRRYHFLAYLYCLLGVFTAIGTGNAVQVNTVSTSVAGLVNGIGEEKIYFVKLFVGISMSVLCLVVLLGGVKRISSAAETIVPAMIILYLALTLGVIIMKIDMVPKALYSIIVGAFNPRAVTAGGIGSFFLTLQKGISRGVFTHESGLGTSAIAYASANTNNAVKQGLFGVFEVFVDTILICTVTALAILCSGVIIPFGVDMGANLTIDAFSVVYGGFTQGLLTVPICIFAFASVIGWGFYGVRCVEFLLGAKFIKPFLFLFCITSIAASVKSTEFVWLLSEICNGLMALPNLIVLYILAPIVIREVKCYDAKSIKKSH